MDLGSNTFRLVVFRYRPGGPFHLVDEIRQTVRLAAGAEDGRLRPEAVDRAARTAALYAAFCRAGAIDEVDAVATSALREARNGREATARLTAAGLPVRVISSEEEARYGVLGVLNSTTLRDGLVLDVGGGSAQLSRIAGRGMASTVGAPLGAVRMTEAFLPGRTASKGQLKQLRRHVAQRLDAVGAPGRGEGRVVGQGGTVRTLAAMDQRGRAYPLDEVHGYRLRRDALDDLIAAMAALPADRRDRLPGLKRDRADILLAGAVVVDAVLERLGVDHLEVAAQGLREGVFYERFLAPEDPPLLPDVREASVLNAARRFGYERAHAEQVVRLALGLYDGLAAMGLHDPQPVEREWLRAAGLLHDVGVLVDYNDHHKHGFYLVLNAGLPGFAHRELAMVALLVRAHRKALATTNGFEAVLEPGDEASLARLAACLRVAEQLERGRAQVVRRLRFDAVDGAVRVGVEAEGDPGLAVWSAAQQGVAFERAFGRRLEVAGAVGSPNPLAALDVEA